MIDFTMIAVGAGLVLTGAIFFGYPLGRRHGSKIQARNACREMDRHGPAVIASAQKRLRSRDVLEAEVIE
ncbi:MAG: hypothetical protein AB7F88_19785 [Pyrinomonadaceae bacterium]